MTTIFSIRKSLKSFHNDERGLEALQVVMIIAVAAIIMLLIKNNYETIRNWMEKIVNTVIPWQEPGGAGVR